MKTCEFISARGSLNETEHFLRRAYRRRLLKNAEVEALKPLADKLGSGLNSQLKSIGRTRAGSAMATDN